MFVAQAHSFTQQARLAITLAWIAGYTNIVSILACGTVTSHVSGTTSNLGRDVAEGKWTLATEALVLLGAFLAGAVLSGFATEFGRRRGWESIYVLPMAIETLLLAAFAGGLELREARSESGVPELLIVLAAGAMGLQNATITRISSGVVRTTHVTGVLTDLGLELAQFTLWMRDKAVNVPPGSVMGVVRGLHTHPTLRRLALLASIVGSFALGAGLGTLVYDQWPKWAMVPPVLFLLWVISVDLARPIAEIEESEVAHMPGLDLPTSIAVYHVRRDPRRKGRAHRLPNLLVWQERLVPAVRVVVLDLTHVMQLDDNAAMELCAALARLRSQGRRMVIAGLTGEQYEQLRRAGAGNLLDPMSVCPDVELGIARALSMVEPGALRA